MAVKVKISNKDLRDENDQPKVVEVVESAAATWLERGWELVKEDVEKVEDLVEQDVQQLGKGQPDAGEQAQSAAEGVKAAQAAAQSGAAPGDAAKAQQQAKAQNPPAQQGAQTPAASGS